MFARKKPTTPPPPPRTMWAEDVQAARAEIQKRRGELQLQFEALVKEEDHLKALCNHTHKGGHSALQVRAAHTDPFGGDDDDRDYTECAVCSLTL